MAGLNWIRAPTTLLPLVWSFVSWIAIFIPELELHTCAKKKGWRKVFHGSLLRNLIKFIHFWHKNDLFLMHVVFMITNAFFFFTFQFSILPNQYEWILAKWNPKSISEHEHSSRSVRGTRLVCLCRTFNYIAVMATTGGTVKLVLRWWIFLPFRYRVSTLEN